MSTLKLVAVSESKTEKVRTDGKVSREYYTAEFNNPANPFGKSVRRTFWQQHNNDGTVAEWRGANPKDVSRFIGKEIPGRIVSGTTEAYEIISYGGEVREATTYTAVVLDGETPEAVFKASGKILLVAANPMVVAEAF